MGEIEVFQRDIADVIVVRHLHLIVVALAVRPGNGTVAHLHHHILGQNVLAVKEHLERPPHLVQRPLTLMERTDDGQQHIGIVFDGVEIKMVFVIIVGSGIGVEVALQLVLQSAVGGLRSQQVSVLGGIGRRADGSGHAVAHRHQRGHTRLQHHQQKKRRQQQEQPAGVFLDVGRHLFRQLARDGRRTLSGLGGLPGRLPRLLCVLAFDLLLLQIPGHRAALLHFRVFLHGLAVVIVRRGLDMLALGTLHRLCRVFPDGLAELAPAEAVHGLRHKFGTVCALRADIFMLDLIEFAMHKAVDAVSGGMGKALDRPGLFRRLLLCQLLPGGVQLLAPALHPQLGRRRLLLPAFPPKLGLRDILSRSGVTRLFAHGQDPPGGSSADHRSLHGENGLQTGW